MRHYATAAVLVMLAGCGEPDRIDPGLWAITTEVTEYAGLSGGRPPNVKFGEPAPFTEIACLATASVEPPQLFMLVGSGGFGCADSIEMRAGKLSATRAGCTTAGFDELVSSRMQTLEGTFASDRFEIEGRSAELFTKGRRLFLAAKFTGRRLGDCPSAETAPEPGEEPPPAGSDLDELPTGLWSVWTETVEQYPAQASPALPFTRHYCLDATRVRRPWNLFEPPDGGSGGSVCDETLATRSGRLSGRRSCRYPNSAVDMSSVEDLTGRFAGESFAARLSSQTTVTATDPETGESHTATPNRQVHALQGKRLGDC